MTGSLLSVGIDVGTSTTQVIFSRLQVRNDATAFTVPEFVIGEKEVLYRGQIRFTPLLSETVIHADALRDMIREEYHTAGISKDQVQTGAVIITGETARKENARSVLEALSGYAGEFVVATAGPALESILAGKGSGAAEYSRKHKCAVLNLDIGGGTTNFALFDHGQVMDTGCLNVGGRLMKFTEGRCSYLSPVLRKVFTEASPPKEVARFLCELLEEAVGLREGKRYSDFVTDKVCRTAPLLSFSGGVADLIEESPRDPYAYGDLGVFLGEAIRQSPLWTVAPHIPMGQTIGATVMGAGLHTTELSGSTIFYHNMTFPLKYLPVARLSPEEESLPQRELISRIRNALEEVAPHGERCVLSLCGKQNPRFSELCRLADTIALSMEDRDALLLSVERDMGKALGQAVSSLLPQKPLLCLDGVRLPDHAYLDIGRPIAGGQVLPVVVKTLIL